MKSTASFKKTTFKAFLVLLTFLLLIPIGIASAVPKQAAHAAGLTTFQNGLYQGQDPFVFQKDGFYYLSQSGPYNPTALYVSKSRSLANQGEKIKVYQANGNLGRIFAPELFYINGQWYIYACADVTAMNGHHHAVVFQGTTQNPQDPFTYKGVLFTGTGATNYQANDFTVFQVGTQLYASWGTLNTSGLPDPTANGPAIARMDSPLSITQNRTLLPGFGGEGPRVLQKNGKTFLTVSSGQWATKGYRMAMYTNTDGNLLNPASWTFKDNVFNTTSEVWGPARGAFTKSADGTEDWMIYHSKVWSADGNGWRQVNIQKFTWNADGSPNFGTPASPFTPLTLPSGDPGIGDVYQAENAVRAGGAGVNTNNAGYTGTGFVDSYYSVGANTTFTVNAPTAGDYLVTLRYSNGIVVAGEQSGTPSIEPPVPNTVSVYVNGTKIRQTSLDKTTDWAHWMLKTEKLTLLAGNNTISYKMDSGDVGLICLDYIAVASLAGGPSPTATRTNTPTAGPSLTPTRTATPNPNPNPVAFYAFENNANDSSGNGQNGTLVNGPTFVAGHLGQAVNLDGVNDYIQIPRAIQDNFTIAFWVKTTTTGGTGTHWWSGKGLVDGEVPNAANDFGVSLVGAQAAFGVGNADTTIKTTSNINNGAWHRVAVTRNATSGQMKIYFDGILQTTATGPTGTKNAPANLRIGSLQTNINFFAGQIDEVRLYNVVLSDAQVAAIP